MIGEPELDLHAFRNQAIKDAGCGNRSGGREKSPVRFTAAIWLIATGFLAGCAGPVTDYHAGNNKILVSRGAYRMIQQNDQATAVFAANADKADSELICERVLVGGYKDIRTLCYARHELEGAKRQHRDTFQEMTLIPGSGG